MKTEPDSLKYTGGHLFLLRIMLYKSYIFFFKILISKFRYETHWFTLLELKFIKHKSVSIANL